MRRIPVLRCTVALGLLLISVSFGLWWTARMPELEQVDLTVLHEEPDGTCEVQWGDPFGPGTREAPYRCDPERDPLLKAPEYRPGTDLGWETGFVIAEGADKGELYSEEKHDGSGAVLASDVLVSCGLLLTFVGVAGGAVRSGTRVSGVRPGVLRRAERLRTAAERVAGDHARAVRAVRHAWEPVHRAAVRERLDRMPAGTLRRAAGVRRVPADVWERSGLHTVRDVLDAGAWGVAHATRLGRRPAEKVWEAARCRAADVEADTVVRLDPDPLDPGTARLLNALRVLVEAGPAARETAGEGARLAGQLERLLADAAPAAGRRQMLDASPEARHLAPLAVTELRGILDAAGQARTAERFAQASVDLLRGSDADPAALAARVDFASRPAAYYGLLAEVVGSGRRAGHTGSGR
ncbi:hypothetical protein [Streptomyces sp. enrichment culture]|uniref:hypothetical protein n=1 Tax=Streptomyces sp. enrichment culture TaxID=1795815 RepID=UPI003F57A449